MTTNRIDHTYCDHAKTPAARKVCRSGFALVGDLRTHDHIHTADGRFFSVVQGCMVPVGGVAPSTEIRVQEWTRDGGWSRDKVWMYAADFAGATVQHDPRNV
jgi:hypothetical protein